MVKKRGKRQRSFIQKYHLKYSLTHSSPVILHGIIFFSPNSFPQNNKHILMKESDQTRICFSLFLTKNGMTHQAINVFNNRNSSRKIENSAQYNFS